jgi:hypothetical protein
MVKKTAEPQALVAATIAVNGPIALSSGRQAAANPGSFDFAHDIQKDMVLKELAGGAERIRTAA